MTHRSRLLRLLVLLQSSEPVHVSPEALQRAGFVTERPDVPPDRFMFRRMMALVDKRGRRL